MSFKFYVMLTQHIIYCILHILPHVLRIKWCSPSWHAASISSIFGHYSILIQPWKTDMPTNQSIWPTSVSGNIRSCTGPISGVPTFFTFRESTFTSWLSQANFIQVYIFFYQKHTWQCKLRGPEVLWSTVIYSATGIAQLSQGDSI